MNLNQLTTRSVMGDHLYENNLGKGLHIAHLNVRSMFGGHKFDMLKQQIKLSGVSVFTLSETWLNNTIPNNLLEIEEYTLVRADRAWGETNGGKMYKRGGGLACYIKKDIKFSESKLAHLNVSSQELEMLWINLSLDNVRPIVIVTIYRPPQGNYTKCCDIISEAFERANLKDNTDIFLLGDFNIDFRDRNTPSYKELDFITKSLSLREVIKSPTRVSFREGVKTEKAIDLIFTNSDFISHTETLNFNISDHLGILVTRKRIATKAEKVNFRGRSYRNYRKETFQDRLVGTNWAPFYNCRDPNKMWKFMYKVISEEIEAMCPIKSFRVDEFKEVWMTNEAVEAIRDKDRLLKRAKRSGKEEEWLEAKRVRNRVGRDIENLRADFLKNQQETNKYDPKKFWKSISSVLPGKKGKSSKIWLKHEDTGEEVPQHLTADFVNKFFTNIGPALARHNKKSWRYFGQYIEEPIMHFVTTEEEVLKLCKAIEPMKSSGMDSLSSKICKDAFMVLGNQLTYLFNCSLTTAIFPEAWKVAKVVPLYKGGNREDVGNYRPVSLLPLPGKMLEKIVHDRITKFWDDNNFLSANQGGFRKGFSTISTIADLTDDLFANINKGDTTLAAFIDLRKAFDTVNLSILIKKLEKAGIRDNMLRWCKNYLANRSQCTLANDVKSKLLPVTCGVPQGSVLGPLFFLVYVNDIEDALDTCGLKLYADDTVIYQSGVSKEEATNKLQYSLNIFTEWCSVNALTINAKKTKLMAFGSRSRVKKAKEVVVTLGNQKLSQVPSFKYLGMILDSTLNFNHQISAVIRTVIHKLILLSKMKRYLKDDTALTIYKSMMMPYFDYADVIFDKAANKDIKKLQRLQNRCLRVCLGKERRFDSDRAHKLTNTPFLRDRRRAHIRNFMYIRKSRRDLLNMREIRTRAHDAPLFDIKVPRCEAFKRSVGYAGALEWNNLTPDMRNIDSYLAFKYAQKKEMLRPLQGINPD